MMKRASNPVIACIRQDANVRLDQETQKSIDGTIPQLYLQNKIFQNSQYYNTINSKDMTFLSKFNATDPLM